MVTTWQIWASKDRWQTQYKASRTIFSREEALRQGKAHFSFGDVSVMVEELFADVPGVAIWQANP